MVGKRIINDDTRAEMKDVLAEIQDGTFARNWLNENMVNRPQFNAIKKSELEHSIVGVGQKLRSMMKWI